MSVPRALLGDPKAVPKDSPDTFQWPIITEEDESAVLEVLPSARRPRTRINY